GFGCGGGGRAVKGVSRGGRGECAEGRGERRKTFDHLAKTAGASRRSLSFAARSACGLCERKRNASHSTNPSASLCVNSAPSARKRNAQYRHNAKLLAAPSSHG